MSNIDFTSDTIRSAKFREKLKGYHPDDVDAFLDRAAESFDRLQFRLAEKERDSEMAVDESFRRTLMLAQRTAETAVQEANLEASRILSAARAEADALIADAEREADRAKATARARLREAEERAAAQEAQAARRIEAYEAEAAAQVESRSNEARRRLQASIRGLKSQEDRLRSQTANLSAYLASERARILGSLATAVEHLETSLMPSTSPPETETQLEPEELTEPPRRRASRAQAAPFEPAPEENLLEAMPGDDIDEIDDIDEVDAVLTPEPASFDIPTSPAPPITGPVTAAWRAKTGREPVTAAPWENAPTPSGAAPWTWQDRRPATDPTGQTFGTGPAVDWNADIAASDTTTNRGRRHAVEADADGAADIDIDPLGNPGDDATTEAAHALDLADLPPPPDNWVAPEGQPWPTPGEDEPASPLLLTLDDDRMRNDPSPVPSPPANDRASRSLMRRRR